MLRNGQGKINKNENAKTSRKEGNQSGIGKRKDIPVIILLHIIIESSSNSNKSNLHYGLTMVQSSDKA